MPGQDLVRPSRDGDQFHYHWAARQCLELLSRENHLVAVTVEGASPDEADGDDIEAGEELIDVGLYYGSETRDGARLVRYIQLKHSTRRTHEPWTSSGLKKTIRGFARRYSELAECYGANAVAQRFRFEFTTNRRIATKLKAALADLGSMATARHPDLQQTLVGYTELEESRAMQFFSLFSTEDSEGDLWAQRNLLMQDMCAYLPDADYDAPIQLKDLVTRKATTEFESDPSIRRHDVLRALKADPDQLAPAPCLIPSASQTLPREQEKEILRALLAAEMPVVIHADGGVGKSVLAARLAASMPSGSEAVLYDCFGDGLYRNSLHFRHRHRDALVQMTNELAARGLCHPLIPTGHADVKLYMRAFVHRLTQAVGLLRARTSDAHLCLIVDAADNAEMAAKEKGEPESFVRDLIRARLPAGVRLAFTCRTHRRSLLNAPLDAQEIELLPFSASESACHLRSIFPLANSAEVAEFAFLSSSNPRVQALALSRGLTLQQMLKQLGPEPTTVDRAIGDLLESAVARLRDQAGSIEASQIDAICQGLAVLRPLVPISVLARLSQTSESAVRSFALDFGRPLFVKGESLHFMDEPAETWFRERFQPTPAALAGFLGRLRPLTTTSSYAAAVLPQLLLQAGQLDELVELALTSKALPTENPLERRDVELQRLTFALKACVQRGYHVAAAKLALKAGGECAGEQRQNNLIQNNTDLAAILMAPDRIEEVVSRRTFGSNWIGSHHAYNAGLLSGRSEFSAEASSGLRMAMDWLRAWSRLPEEERRQEEVSDTDRAELAMALLRLRGPDAAAQFLRGWTWRALAFETGRHLARRLCDLGEYDHLDALAKAAGNDVWLLLGLAAEARAVAYALPAASLSRLLRLLADRRVKLSEPRELSWTLLHAVRSALELALRVLPPEPEVWAEILRRYLPTTPPPQLADRFGFDRAPLLRSYALEAALRGRKLELVDVAPPDVREQLEASNQYGRSDETRIFLQEVGGPLPWFVLSAEIACNRTPHNLADVIEAAAKETSAAESRSYYRDGGRIRQTIALEWFDVLSSAGATQLPELEAFKSWLAKQKDPLWPDTLISLCRAASRTKGGEALALDVAADAYEALGASREDAESRAESYVRLARAVLAVSTEEANAFFDHAVEIASRIGDENLNRWEAFLHLAKSAGESDNPRPQSAYRLSRIAELTYEYVARDKHFDWGGTAHALTDLCPSSALAILSRWRDRRFGDPARLLPLVVYRLLDQNQLPATTPIVFGGLEAEWDRIADLKRAIATETDLAQRSVIARVAYRYIRVQPRTGENWSALGELSRAYGLNFPDIDRLIASHSEGNFKRERASDSPFFESELERRTPDWDEIFHDVDFADADALRAAYGAVRTYDPPYEVETFFSEAFERVSVGRTPNLVRAVTAWPDFGIFELRYLLDALPSPLPRQVSLKRAVRDAVLTVCRREPERIKRRGWGAWIKFETLYAEGLVSDSDVVQATLQGFAEQIDNLGASELFQMVDPLVSCLSPNEADEALNFGCDLLEALLPEDGEGPWSPVLQPPQSLIAAMAGHVWAGLGSPVAAERWQYAHVVRSAVELGWSDFIDALVAWAGYGHAGAFVDQALQFYVWHARQWLLIGLARGGLENSAALRPGIPLLKLCLREDHVLIRELAAQALRTLVADGELKPGDAGDLNSVNRPTPPAAIYSGWLEPTEDETSLPEEAVNDDKYYFGIDIRPYWFGPLGRAFGLTEDAIERRARHALRKHMGWSDARQQDARHTRGIFRDRETYHSHGSLPMTDDLCAYHGYHALMLVAAVLLEERPVRRRADEATDEFQEWLADYLLTRADGKWLADRRDPRLVQDPPPADGYGDTPWCWNVTSDHLDQKLVSDDGLIVLWGDWIGGEQGYQETVAVRSALVPQAGAEALVAALQTAPELGRFSLPRAGDTEDMEVLESERLKLTGWVTSGSVAARLDESDPWAEGITYPGPAPADDMIEKLALAESAHGGTWSLKPDGLLRSETWTHTQGYAREAETVPGSRLSGDRVFVKRMLEVHPEDRLLLSVEVRRWPPRHRRDQKGFQSYLLPYARYYLMGADGVAHAL